VSFPFTSSRSFQVWTFHLLHSTHLFHLVSFIISFVSFRFAPICSHSSRWSFIWPSSRFSKVCRNNTFKFHLIIICSTRVISIHLVAVVPGLLPFVLTPLGGHLSDPQVGSQRFAPICSHSSRWSFIWPSSRFSKNSHDLSRPSSFKTRLSDARDLHLGRDMVIPTGEACFGEFHTQAMTTWAIKLAKHQVLAVLSTEQSQKNFQLNELARHK
jgi:hypothetical protein